VQVDSLCMTPPDTTKVIWLSVACVWLPFSLYPSGMCSKGEARPAGASPDGRAVDVVGLLARPHSHVRAGKREGEVVGKRGGGSNLGELGTRERPPAEVAGRTRSRKLNG